jgi:hypothetical protein
MQHGSERRTSDPAVRHHHQRTHRAVFHFKSKWSAACARMPQAYQPRVPYCS